MSDFSYLGHELRPEHVHVLQVLDDHEDKWLRASDVEAKLQADYEVRLTAPGYLRILGEWGFVKRSDYKNASGSNWRSNVYTYVITEDGAAALGAYKIWLGSGSADAESVAAGEVGRIEAKQRRELKTLLGRRKQLLQLQLKTRRDELEALIRANLNDDFAGKKASFTDKLNELNARVRKVQEDFIALKQEGERQGLSYSNQYDKLAVLDGEWWVKDMGDRVRRELAKLQAEKGVAAVNLEEQFLELEEKLTIMGLDEDARTFLDSLPTVDKFLPTATEAALQLAGGEDVVDAEVVS